MSEIDEALEGRVTVGKSRRGDEREIHHLILNGRQVYRMQRLLEGLAVNEENYFRVREAVLLAEALREAVSDGDDRGPLQGGTGGG